MENENKNAKRRPSWNQYFMQIAFEVATRSTCLRRNTGAIVVKKRRILATGYNGAPRGIKHCSETGCLRKELDIPSGERHELCRGLHAEQNAILQAALHGVSLWGGTIYTTHQPCVVCAKMITNVEIKNIYYVYSYPDELAEKILAEANIKSKKLNYEGPVRNKF